MVIQRPGDAAPLAVTVYPKRTKPFPTIGILPPMSTVLSSELPVLPGTAAAKARPEFMPDDQIVAIDGQPIENYAQVHRALALAQDRAISVTVEATPPSPKDRGKTPRRPAGQRATIPVAAVPVRHLGMVMEMGKVTAVQGDSPAQAAGIMPAT